MKRNLWPTRDSVKDYFPLPKEIFSLGLSAAEIAIYAYLLFCEDRQTFQCWPSYQKMRGMSYQEVLRTNGQISFPEVLRQQKRL